MKSIQETVRKKELEILKSVEEALQQKELELRQLQKTLVEALRLVNRLLESDNPEVEAVLADAKRFTPQPVAAAATPAKPAPAWEQSGKQFP